MAGLCLALGAAVVALGVNQVELRWTHSVQKSEWREQWSVTAAGLVLQQAAVQSSGAGMDPGEDAVMRDGFWVWRPALPPQPELILTRSPYTPGDWHLCTAAGCHDLGGYFPGIAADQAVTMRPCGPGG
ncbi:MAG: DUF1850 domain-containing protein [Ferrovibrio sp.]